MKRFLLLLVFFLNILPFVAAQPANDECEGAIVLPEVRNWCSGQDAFTSLGATPSTYEAASCFSTAANDVWFSFTPVATDVTITVIGNTGGAGSGGTLVNPEVALYFGTCGGTINQQQCASDTDGNNIIEINKGGLAIGQQYLVRVQGRGGRTGTFQLCINNFNPPVLPGSDCFDAAILCNKESFIIQKVQGAGSDPTEANDAPCLNQFPGNVESASTWMTWTAANDGQLTFTLTPLGPTDDLDFVLYELPNGPQVCQNKRVLRCMASGELKELYPSRCHGPTGLREGETDIAEPAGCDDPRQNNFIAPIDMQAGVSYALMVNNFSPTGNGFRIDFGGDGEFQGPDAAFTTDAPGNTVCVGKELSITDASTFALGAITNWEWSFGPDASIPTASGRGPHQVSYNRPGTKAVVLTVTSEQGCIVTSIDSVFVECCSDHFAISADIADVRCPADNSGQIDLSVTNAFGPYLFGWSSGQTTEDVSSLTPGDYTVLITDAATCDTTLTFTVGSPPPLLVDTLIQQPTCGGGTDGSITLQLSGGTPGYAFNWENGGYISENSFSDLPAGNYSVVIRDQNDCETPLTIEVRELELILDPVVSSIVAPSCTGFSDGEIEVVVANGQPAFVYDWNDGRGYQDENSLRGLSSGVYNVEVQDANLCQGSFSFNLEDPPPLTLSFDPLDASCNGTDDGQAAAIAGGGVGTYTYQWSTGQTDSVATQLPAGTYSVTVLDDNGCEIQDAVIIGEPAVVDISVLDLVDVICNGQSTGQVTVEGLGGNPPYEYSVDGLTFQASPTFGNLAAGNYTFTVLDALGCSETVEASISEPPPLVVDAGEDLTVRLGFTIRLRAVASVPGVSYQWSPTETLSCIDCSSPVASPVTDQIYTVLVNDASNCTALDSVRVTIDEDRSIYIPNAFSPDGDGINDYFTIFGGPSVREVRSLKIFDRWGELIYDGRNLPANEESAGWDGTYRGRELSTAVFVFMAEIEFIDGEVITYKGDVAIFR